MSILFSSAFILVMNKTAQLVLVALSVALASSLPDFAEEQFNPRSLSKFNVKMDGACLNLTAE